LIIFIIKKLFLKDKTDTTGTLGIKIFIEGYQIAIRWHDFYSIIITKDLFKYGVLHNCKAEKYPQYLIWVMPAKGILKRFNESFF